MELRTDQRMALLGRLRMAEWIEMPEGEFAREIEKIEKDPLFKKLYFGTPEAPGIIRRQRWPRSAFSGGFYEVNEQIMAGGQRVAVEELLGENAKLLPKIRKMGREAFERYFLYAEEALPLEKIAERTGMSLEEIEAVNDLLVEIGAQAEFAGPQPEPAAGGAYTCLARITIADSEPSFEFFSPYWARGLYRIRYDLLEDWKHGGNLDGSELKKLPHMLKRLETINLRQNTLFRILESLSQLQAEYLRTHRDDLLRPISLRNLAYRLDLAPSTVSRAIACRSAGMPWGKDQPLISLLPGRRKVLREVLSRWLEESSAATDSRLAQRLKEEYGIRISRRTVNAVRHELSGR